jgi:hypothetical protein
MLAANTAQAEPAPGGGRALVRAPGIGGMRSSHSAERWGRSDSGVPESPAPARKSAGEAPKFRITNGFLDRL